MMVFIHNGDILILPKDKDIGRKKQEFFQGEDKDDASQMTVLLIMRIAMNFTF